MASFRGIVTAISAEQSGVSKSTGKQWRKIDVVLTYDNSKPEYPKAITFSIMNDKIEQAGLVVGQEYDVEIDFSVHEYNDKYYLSASCWKALPVTQQTQPQAAPGYAQYPPQANAMYPPQQPQQAYSVPPQPQQPAAMPPKNDGLPF